MKKLLLIDGHSILNRAFYGVPEMTDAQGRHTNAVYGFLTMMLKVLEEEGADALAVAFDLKAPTFRHKMYAAYKGTRKPMPEALHEQVPLMKQMLTAMGIPILMQEGYEADDILGTVAKRCQAMEMVVTILSGDRDLLQLADEQILICQPRTIRGKTEVFRYHPEELMEEYGITPHEVIEMKALMGDASDNIPGVPSIGEKTAKKIIQEYHTIEEAWAHIDEITPPRAQKALREHYDMAQMSKTLATINIQVPLDFDPESAAMGNMFTPEAYQLCSELEFRSLLGRFSDGAPAEHAVAGKIRLIEDHEAVREILEKAKAAPELGLAVPVEDGVPAGLAAALTDEEIFFIPAAAFPEEMTAGRAAAVLLSGKTRVSVIELKPILHILEDPGREVLDGGANDGGSCRIFDAGIGAYLLDPLKDRYGYEELAAAWLGDTLPGESALRGKRGWAAFVQEEPLRAAECAGYMAYTALRLRPVLEARLKEENMWHLYTEIEMPTVYTLFHMEEEGIAVLREELAAYGAKLQVAIGETERDIYRETGHVFNINSPKQLGEILFEEMHMPGGKKTKTGWSTAAGVLDKLAPDFPFVQKILDYRQYTKLKSTYADGLAQYIGPDGRIHGTFNQTITATGRISSTEPNLQNIPVRMELGREIRRLFVPREGWLFTDADYSQIELRVLASMSGDEHLIEAYHEAEDIHAITAAQVFHVPLEEVTPELRRNAKAVNFGIVYGISNFGLSVNLNISRKEAEGYIERYFETYPGVKRFIDSLVDSAREKGYSETLFGRRRPMPELHAANFMQRQFGERVAMNAPIQGTAADIIKIAMLRVDRRLRREGLKSRLVLQIHDELLIETAPGEKEQVARILTEEMRGAADLRVALEVSMATGESWFDAK